MDLNKKGEPERRRHQASEMEKIGTTRQLLSPFILHVPVFRSKTLNMYTNTIIFSINIDF
jgi:hypothetical protein